MGVESPEGGFWKIAITPNPRDKAITQHGKGPLLIEPNPHLFEFCGGMKEVCSYPEYSPIFRIAAAKFIDIIHGSLLGEIGFLYLFALCAIRVYHLPATQKHGFG